MQCAYCNEPIEPMSIYCVQCGRILEEQEIRQEFRFSIEQTPEEARQKAPGRLFYILSAAVAMMVILYFQSQATEAELDSVSALMYGTLLVLFLFMNILIVKHFLGFYHRKSRGGARANPQHSNRTTEKRETIF